MAPLTLRRATKASPSGMRGGRLRRGGSRDEHRDFDLRSPLVEIPHWEARGPDPADTGGGRPARRCDTQGDDPAEKPRLGGHRGHCRSGSDRGGRGLAHQHAWRPDRLLGTECAPVITDQNMPAGTFIFGASTADNIALRVCGRRPPCCPTPMIKFVESAPVILVDTSGQRCPCGIRPHLRRAR